MAISRKNNKGIMKKSSKQKSIKNIQKYNRNNIWIGGSNNIIQNYKEIIDSLYYNKPIPSIIIPKNLCENKKRGFYKLTDNNNNLNKEPLNIQELMSNNTIPKELLYCLGSDNKIIGTNYDDILPTQDSISQ